MKIKHLVLLFLVNCGSKMTAAESNTTIKAAHTLSSADLLTSEVCPQEASIIIFSFHTQRQYNKEVISLDRNRILVHSQIEFTDKKIVKSDYKQTVGCDEYMIADKNDLLENSLLTIIRHTI